MEPDKHSTGELDTGIYHDVGHTFSYLVKHFSAADPQKVHSHSSSVKKLKEGTLKTLAKVECNYTSPELEGIGTSEFIVKYWWPRGTETMPEGFFKSVKDDPRPWETEYKQYKLLEGSTNLVPKAYLIEDILKSANGFSSPEEMKKFIRKLDVFNRCLFIDYVGSRTFEEEIVNSRSSHQERYDKVKNLLERIIEFQDVATKRCIGAILNPNERTSLFSERKPGVRFVDYIRAWMGHFHMGEIPLEIRQQVEHGFEPLINDHGDCGPFGVKVCHGDLRRTGNVIVTFDGDYEFIDMKLKLGDGITDAAAIISAPGINLHPRDWDELANHFRVKQFEKAGAEYKSKDKELGWLVGEAEIEISQDTEKNTRRKLYNKIIDESIRTIAKLKDTQKYLPEVYNRMIKSSQTTKNAIPEMARNINLALTEIIANPHNFKTEHHLRNYIDLKDLLIHLGIIHPEIIAAK